MEMQLKMLQERMRKQQESTSTTSNSSGSGRWKSANKEKGSIRGYGKDVQEKFQVKQQQRRKQSEDGITLSSAEMRRAGKHSQPEGIQSKNVELWEIKDVTEWLGALSLSQYVSVFAQNEITGSVLLDITLEDLDYMQITALGHRKTILKAVESLRQNNCYQPTIITNTVINKNDKQPVMRTLSNPTMKQSYDTELQNHKKEEDNSPKLTHWSNLEPLSSKQVINPGGPMVNAADGVNSYDVLDEAAERKAFQDAVAEWRKSAGVKSNEEQSSTNANADENFNASNGGGLWQNPFAGPSTSNNSSDQDVLDEEEERRAFQAAVADWRTGNNNGGTSSKVTIVREYKGEKSGIKSGDILDEAAEQRAFQAAVSEWRGTSETNSNSIGHSNQDTHKTKSESTVNVGNHNGGALLEGSLDEEREHAEFVRAVNAWRVKHSQNDKDGRDGSTALSSLAAQQVAAQLSKDLESEQAAATERIRKQKEEAEKRIREANKEIERIRNAMLNNPPTASAIANASNQDNFDDSMTLDEDSQLPPYRGQNDTNTSNKLYSYSSVPSDNQANNNNIATPDITPRENNIPNTTVTSRVEVALVESVLNESPYGSPNAGNNSRFIDDSIEEDYLVIEADSDSD